MVALKSVRPLVFWVPLTILIVAVTASLIDRDSFLSITTATNDWVIATFSSAYSTAALLFVLTCGFVAVSPIGKVRIGGKNAKPILSRWNWFAITLSTTVAIGILFWAAAEPIFHLYQPGALDVDPESDDAAAFAMSSLFMHWAITPYAIYTIPGLTFALAYYNLNQPFSLSGPFNIILGRSMPRGIADLVDILVLLAVVFGLSASLGTGLLSIAGGISNLTGWTTDPLLLAGIACCIVSVFFISSASGLQRGIRFLSDFNVKAFIGFALLVVALGPTLAMLKYGWAGLAGYVSEFIPRSLNIGKFSDRQWVNSWTVFYWANWLTWAPLTGMFLGRIAKGYKVREFIVVNCLLPAAFSIFWLTIFSGSAIHFDTTLGGALKHTLDQSGPGAVLYSLINQLPLATTLTYVILGLSFLSYITAADSNTDAIASLSLGGYDGQRPRPATIWIKFIWATLIGAVAWVLVAYAGLDGIRMMSNLGGLPALIIVSGLCVVLVTLSTVGSAKLTNP